MPSVSARRRSPRSVRRTARDPSRIAAGGSRGTSKGAVYRISPDGVWDQLWESRDDSPYDLTFDQNGALIVGTGSKGKLYRLEGDPLRPTLLARASAQQVTAFHKDAARAAVLRDREPGQAVPALARAGARAARTSPSRATRRWCPPGARSAGAARVAGRQPHRAVHPIGQHRDARRHVERLVSRVHRTPDGSPITSPKARYLQWRAVLTGKGDGPVLTSVTAAYLQRNLRPQVRSVTVHPPGIVFQKPFSTGDPDLAGFDDQTTPGAQARGRAARSQGARAGLGTPHVSEGAADAVWRADDENDDDLVYDVLFRREGETRVEAAAPGRRRKRSSCGTRPRCRTARTSSRSSRPTGRRIRRAPRSTGELDSSAFEVDNTPPAIAVGGVRVDRGRTIVTLRRQGRSLADPARRVLAGRPALARRVSGRRHRRLPPGALRAGGRRRCWRERGLTLRVIDSMNNVETGHVDAPRRSAVRQD